AVGPFPVIWNILEAAGPVPVIWNILEAAGPVPSIRSTPSDISPVVELVAIYFFYFVGSVSLIVNSITLAIIVWKGAILDREIRWITVLLQVSCLAQNAFITLLFIPFFFYLRPGAGYCMGFLSGIVPYEVLLLVTKFFSGNFRLFINDDVLWIWMYRIRSTTIANFGRIVLEIEQHNEKKPSMGIWLSTFSDRARQIQVLHQSYPQLKWRERGLNWYLFDFVRSPVVLKYAIEGVPLLYRLYAGRQARINQPNGVDNVHVRNAKTVAIQFTTLLLFLALPQQWLSSDVTTSTKTRKKSSMRNCNMTANPRNRMTNYNMLNNAVRSSALTVVVECIFACSSLANSYVVIARNRRYLEALTTIFHRTRHNEILPNRALPSVSSRNLFVRRNVIRNP
ncbi:hypothetical protein PRIPAC_81039, partial [Pristionchus pacificus]|uniref:Uncharacterized protein n=1 Tax=Pristionchus pacificus TaxID=54126 RepID=A0A2A6CJE9_PRIPA